MFHTQRSKELFATAQKIIPGGVNSPVRAFRAVGCDPLFIAKANGAQIFDADGNSFIDYVCSWGALILGHAHPTVLSAISEAAALGTSYGAPTEREIILARKVCEAIPSMQKVRFVNSGTEATMSALRLARAFTRRPAVIKFAGCYHGHADSFLVQAGSGGLTLGVPDSPGITGQTAQDTLVVPYNDLAAVEEAFAHNPDRVAAVIVEPIAANMGFVRPKAGFLEGLRKLTLQYGALLIFDEVITGFRVAYGGAQELFGTKADLTCLGKIIGGGLPVGAFGGREDIMNMLAPVGPVYQAGTLSGNPLAMAAGIATLDLLKQQGGPASLAKSSSYLATGFATLAKEAGVPLQTDSQGALFGFFFTDKEVDSLATAKTANTERFGRFFRAMLENGIYLAPSQFEASFVSFAHTQAALDKTLEIARTAFRTLS